MQILSSLPPVTEAQRTEIFTAPRTAEAHRGLLAALPAMNTVQTGGTPSQTHLPGALTVVAWNVERCLFPEDAAQLLAPDGPQVVLLSEVDHGMARTGQRHTTEEMAAELGMTYAFGVEFHELDLGGPTERGFCTDDFNATGWHGNAILSKAPFKKLSMIRLDDHGHWFSADSGAADPDQPRVGGRMALLAVVPTADGPLCVVSTHLESNADGRHREIQFARLLDAIDAFASGMPVLIGGDLNTGNHMPPDFDWRGEALFPLAETRGYDWSFTPDGMTTRPSLITPHPTRKMKLDWFCARGLALTDKRILPALNGRGVPLSDHEAILCETAVAPRP